MRGFLDEFEAYIGEQFMGIKDMTKREQVIQTATDSAETLEAALEVGMALDDIKLRLLKTLCEQLGHAAAAAGWIFGTDFGTEFNLYGREQSFSFGFKEHPKYKVSFEFEGSQCNGFIYGIAKVEEALPDLPDVRSCLEERLGHGKSSPWWPWYHEFDAPLRDWSSFTEPWTMIRSGSMATTVVERVRRIHDTLVQQNLLDRLS